MLGTQSVLFSKALSTLLRTTFDGDSQLDTWFFYILLLLFICTAAFWVSRLNKVSLACLHRAVCLLLLWLSKAGLAFRPRCTLCCVRGQLMPGWQTSNIAVMSPSHCTSCTHLHQFPGRQQAATPKPFHQSSFRWLPDVGRHGSRSWSWWCLPT